MAWKRSSVRSRSGPPNLFNSLNIVSGNNKPVPRERSGMERLPRRPFWLKKAVLA
jgi:hypothetical protein